MEGIVIVVVIGYRVDKRDGLVMDTFPKATDTERVAAKPMTERIGLLDVGWSSDFSKL